MSFYEGVVGGRSVGTPGVLRMLDAAHRARTASCRGAGCSSPRSGSPSTASRSARGSTLIASDKYLKNDPAARVLQPGRHAEGSRHGAEEPRARDRAAPGRRPRRERVLQRRDRARHRHEGAQAPDQPACCRCRISRLQGEGARAAVRRLPALGRVRDAAAVVGRPRDRADARHPRSDARLAADRRAEAGAQRRRLRADTVRRAPVQRSRTPRVCGPRALRRRSRFRAAARWQLGEPHRQDLSRAARAPDRRQQHGRGPSRHAAGRDARDGRPQPRAAVDVRHRDRRPLRCR